MKAIVLTGNQGLDSVEVRDVPRPDPHGERVLVRVRAAGLNRADLLQSRGLYPAPAGVPADIPGLEFAGEVAALGSDVTSPLQVGDRVMGIVAGGAFAESLTIHERLLVPIPESLNDVEAAALPEAFITAHDALDHQARVRSGESVLIHAVGGGVGTAAVQVAHAMGCVVFGTSRTAAKLDRCRELGLDVSIDTSVEDFADRSLRETDGTGVHAVIDFLGASSWEANLRVLRTGGRLVLVGLLGGVKVEANLGILLEKRLTVIGTTLRARPLEEKIAATRRFTECVLPWIRKGRVRPIIEAVYPLDQARAAFRHIASNSGFGKIVLRMDDPVS